MASHRSRHGDALRIAELAWIAAPFGLFLLVLQHLWTDAPVWDDYDAILGLYLRADELRTPGEWLAMIFGQHNEHRIAVMRLVALGVERVMGSVDFRVLMLIGDLTLLGTFLFIWREFRDEVAPPIIGAAGFVMFQWSYYEASLMGSAALPHLGAIFFSFGCVFFALRGGARSVALCIAFGLLAAASQANGLLALPIAAAGCFVWKRNARGALLAACALVVWLLYFRGYAKPQHHPSLLAAFASPLQAAQLFCVVIGGILPGVKSSMILGALMAAAVAAGIWKGLWRDRPVATMWVVLVLAAAGAATVGRAGFGVVPASRYAILSTALLVTLALWGASLVRPAGTKAVAAILLAGVAAAASVSLSVWHLVREYALRPKLLREAVPSAAGFGVDRYGGAFYPDQARATAVLAASAERDYYHPRKRLVHPPQIVATIAPARAPRLFGHVDGVTVSGSRVTVFGWSDITGEVSGRLMRIVTRPAFAKVGEVNVVARQDVAFALKDPDQVYSGFKLHLDYGSEAEAQQAAKSICVIVEAPGREPARLAPSPPGCGE